MTREARATIKESKTSFCQNNTTRALTNDDKIIILVKKFLEIKKKGGEGSGTSAANLADGTNVAAVLYFSTN